MYAHNLRAPTNPDAPEPVGICDRCGFLYPLARLVDQYQYAGNALKNTHIKVCVDRCLDVPSDQLRPVIISGIEGTVRDPRPAQYAADAEGGQTLPTSPNFPLNDAITD